MRKNDKNLQYEICIMCGTQTDIPISLPIDQRKNYVSGIGQLCESCVGRLYRDEQDGKTSTRELIELLSSFENE
ncbi:MAG: hypothetical protein IJY33_04665 [Oscillospiraceae bacterium]|nr:hypothetical protein [Oscillospiraceae bacterium]